MRIFDDPDDVFTTLRLPGSDVELRDESRVVDLMANAHPTHSGDPMTTSTRFTSRRARVAALIAAGVIGFGGVAAAGPGGLDPLGLGPEETVPEETVPEETVPDETVPDETVPDETVPDETVPDETVPDETVPEETVPDETVSEEPSVARSVVEDEVAAEEKVDVEVPCLPGNHGTTVSAVARGEEGFEGIEVRDAARSDCGKKKLDEVESDGDGEVDDVTSDSSELPAPGADSEGDDTNSSKKGGSGKPDSPGKSGGKGKQGKQGK